MTMHLAPQFNSLRNRKYKPVMTKTNIAKWEKGMIVHNRQCKRLGEPKLSFEQYVDYVHGISPKRDLRRDRSTYRPKQTNYRPQVEYPSAPMSATCDTSKKEPLRYIGTALDLCIVAMPNSLRSPVYLSGSFLDVSHVADIGALGYSTCGR